MDPDNLASIDDPSGGEETCLMAVPTFPHQFEYLLCAWLIHLGRRRDWRYFVRLLITGNPSSGDVVSDHTVVTSHLACLG